MTKSAMDVNAYDVFENMFMALDAYWDEHHDDTLAGYLSEANPYLFGGKGSADPAVWIEFEREFLKRFPSGSASLADAHDFVVSYLDGISKEYSLAYPGETQLTEAFLDIAPLERWEEVFEPRS